MDNQKSNFPRALLVVPRIHPNLEEFINQISIRTRLSILVEFIGQTDGRVPKTIIPFTFSTFKVPYFSYPFVSPFQLCKQLLQERLDICIYRDLCWNNTYYATFLWLLVFLFCLFNDSKFVYYHQVPRGPGEKLINRIKLDLIAFVSFFLKKNRFISVTPCIDYPQPTLKRLSRSHFYFPFITAPVPYTSLLCKLNFNSLPTINIVYIGKLWSHNKRLDVALDIFISLRKSFDCKLFIIGEMPTETSPHSFGHKVLDDFCLNHPEVSLHVKLIGSASRDLVHSIFQDSHIFLFASRHEQAGFSHIEAMSYGLIPIVMRDQLPYNTHVNYVNHKVNGFIFDEFCINEAVDWITSLLSSSSRRTSAIKNSALISRYNRVLFASLFTRFMSSI